MFYCFLFFLKSPVDRKKLKELANTTEKQFSQVNLVARRLFNTCFSFAFQVYEQFLGVFPDLLLPKQTRKRKSSNTADESGLSATAAAGDDDDECNIEVRLCVFFPRPQSFGRRSRSCRDVWCSLLCCCFLPSV